MLYVVLARRLDSQSGCDRRACKQGFRAAGIQCILLRVIALSAHDLRHVSYNLALFSRLASGACRFHYVYSSHLLYVCLLYTVSLLQSRILASIVTRVVRNQLVSTRRVQKQMSMGYCVGRLKSAAVAAPLFFRERFVAATEA